VNWEPLTVKMSLTTSDAAGANTYYSHRWINIRAKGGQVPVLINNQLIAESGLTIAPTFAANTMTITATPSGGAPYYLWDLDVQIGNEHEGYVLASI
jgi:hypothetical protein